ncbi:uncharacterized protein LOC144605578 [Rhinoraja longicauda]
MKKQATRCKRKALCILYLVLLLPLATPQPWCNFRDNLKRGTTHVRRLIEQLNDNLLLSFVQYEVLTDSDAKNLTDCCFIDVTARQLSTAFEHLLEYFRKNTTNYNVTKNIITWLNGIRVDSIYNDKCAAECMKPIPRIVNGCTSGLFSYSKAYIAHYDSIFDRCQKQHSKDFSFPRDLSTSVELNSCLTVLHSNTAASSFVEEVCSRYLPAPSRPSPLTTSAVPGRATMGNELGSAANAVGTLVNPLKGDKIGGTAADKKAPLTADPDYRQVNVSLAASSHGGATTEAQSVPIFAVSPSLTGTTPSGITAQRKGGDEAKKMNNNMPIFSVFIALFVVISFAAICTYQIRKKMNQRLAHGEYHAAGADPDNSNSFLDDSHYEL